MDHSIQSKLKLNSIKSSEPITSTTIRSSSFLKDFIPISQFSNSNQIMSTITTTTTTTTQSTSDQPIQSNQLTLPFPSSSTSINSSSNQIQNNSSNQSIITKSNRKPSTSSSSSNNTNHIKPIKPPAQCSFCGITFKKLEHCQRHERTHTLARPYPCTVCLKTFARQDTLNRHLRLHTRPEDGQTPKTKKRNHRNSISSNNTTPPTPTHSTLPCINLPTEFNSSTYFSSPQLTRSRPARERGFSLSAIDEQSPYHLNPTYHPTLQLSSQQRQSISLPPHWNQFPNHQNQNQNSNQNQNQNQNPNPNPNPNPNQNPNQNPNPSDFNHWESNPNLNPNQNQLTSTSPLLPNLSLPTPLDSNFLAELSSYTLTDLPPSTAHPNFQSIPTSHSQSNLLPPPMSAPPTCTTWGDLSQPFHSNPSTTTATSSSSSSTHLLPPIDQENEFLLDPWTNHSNSNHHPTWFGSNSNSTLNPSYQLSSINPSYHHHELSTRNLENQNSVISLGSGSAYQSTSQPEGFHDWNLSNPSTTYHT